MRRVMTFVLLMAIIASPAPARAASRQKVRRLNVALQPLFTLASAALQGKLRSRGDWYRCLRVGAASGYLFFRSKELAGNGDVLPAVLLANVAASLPRNAAAGRHSLARVGLNIGPLRTEVSTPFERDADARVHLTLSAAEVIALGAMWERSDEIEVRDGLIAFRSRKGFEADGTTFDGYTIGYFPGTLYGRDDVLWQHEAVHAIQSLQVDSVEPPWCAWLRKCRQEPRPYRFLRLEPLELGVITGADALAFSQQSYQDRWIEIEAYRLANRTPPVTITPSLTAPYRLRSPRHQSPSTAQ